MFEHAAEVFEDKTLFCVYQGLEAQLLGIVVRKERPELEEQKDSLVINIASGKRKLQELEDEILRWAAHTRSHISQLCISTFIQVPLTHQ